MSKLLIKELPLMILPQLAKAIGLNEAIVLQQLHYWLLTSPVERDGMKWVFNTYEDWEKQFPFWSISTIGRVFRSLEEKKLTITKKFKRAGYDQTKWYTINYQNDTLKDANVTSSNMPKENNLIKEIKEDTISRDIIDGIIKYSGKPSDKLEGWPPLHAELVRPFCEFYRYPYKDENKSWIAQVEVWLGRGYQPSDVVNACKYVKATGWEYYQPSSILKAFGKKVSGNNDDQYQHLIKGD